jgi:NAD(P)-dependent dehydrogenase (short-subunit alcohol dehydrogenase family)
MTDLFDLSGRNVVLTGGAGILGTRMAAALCGHGATVALVDRNGEAVETALAGLAGGKGAGRGYVIDIADPAAVADLREQVEGELGDVHVLINAAATKSAHFFDPFETFPAEDWAEVMAVNLNGAVSCCQQFGGAMARRGAGSIVNVLSIYGIVAPDQRIYEGSEYEGRPINTPAVYSASKAALWGLTRYLAAYWGEQGVRVNALTPGGAYSGQNETFVERYAQRVPLGRMAQPTDMAGAIVFLASDASGYVTGHNLVVDGGLTAW